MAHLAWGAAAGTLALCLALAFWLMTEHVPGREDEHLMLGSLYGAQAVLAVAVAATGVAHWRSDGRVHGARLAVAALALVAAPVLELLVLVDTLELRAGLHTALGLTAAAGVGRAVWGHEVDTQLRFARECLCGIAVFLVAAAATSVVASGPLTTSWRALLVGLAWSVVAVVGLSRSARRGWVLMAWVSWAAVAFAISEVTRAVAVALDPRWMVISESMGGAGLLVAAVGGTWVLALAARSHRSDVYGTLLDGLTMQEQAEGRRRELAHEVRNTVFVMEGAVTEIGHGGEDDADASLRELRRVVGSGLTMLRQLVDDGADDQELDSFRLDAVVADCVSSARARRLPVNFHCEGGVAALGHPAMAERVVTNLVMNAERHGGAGVGRPVIVSVERDEERHSAVVRVHDTGPGIAPSLQAAAFVPGGQVGRDRSGDGLGLSVARDLAHRQGGTLRYEPSAGGGACFALSLPLAGTVIAAAGARFADGLGEGGHALGAD